MIVTISTITMDPSDLINLSSTGLLLDCDNEGIYLNAVEETLLLLPEDEIHWGEETVTEQQQESSRHDTIS